MILFTTDGTVSVLTPAPDCGLTVEEIMAKDIPAGATVQVVDGHGLPKEFRRAWRMDAKKFWVDESHARTIAIEHTRARRVDEFAKLDLELMRAIEGQKDTAPIARAKQAMRDITTHPVLLNGRPGDLLALMTTPLNEWPDT